MSGCLTTLAGLLFATFFLVAGIECVVIYHESQFDPKILPLAGVCIFGALAVVAAVARPEKPDKP